MVTTSNSCTLVGIDAEIVEVECTISLAPADLRKAGSRSPIAARSIDRLIQVARTSADRLDLDNLDAGRLREATAHRDAAPTTDLVSHVR